MSFDEEWAAAKAAAQENTGVQLDGAGGGKQKQLHVTASVLRSRAKHAEEDAAKEFKQAHRNALSKSSDVPGSMAGFSCDDAMQDFVDGWRKGVQYVAGQIGDDGLAKSLRSAADTFQGGDGKVRDDFEGERRKNEGQQGDEGHEKKPKYTYKPGDVI